MIIPSIYQTRKVGESSDENSQLDNHLLRMGHVQKIIYPEDERSLTRRFIEYDVLVQHVGNGTAVTKLYQNCLMMNSMAGMADKFVWTLRPSPEQSLKDSQDKLGVDYGSTVLLLCLNGQESQALIIGGIRNDQDSDKGTKPLGTHLEFVFNGVALKINDDGSWSVQYLGKSQPDGTRDPAVAIENVGTEVKVSQDGNFTVQTRNGTQSVVINHAAGTITVTGDKDITLNAKKIHLGKDAGEHAVLGDTLKARLDELADALISHIHPHPLGPTGPSTQVPLFQKFKAQLKTILSQFTFIKRDP